MYQRQADLPYPQVWEYILNKLNNQENLFFVDIGAYDGLTVSNTAAMEMNLNWKGICIEPNPVAFELLTKNRNCKCYNIGISNIEGVLPYLKVSGYAEMLSGFSDFYNDEHLRRIDREIAAHGGTKESIPVEVKTISSILDENNITRIDYMSIDTEGNEENIIKSIDFNKYDIRYITVENSYDDKTSEDFLSQFGYKKIDHICGDDVFEKQ